MPVISALTYTVTDSTIVATWTTDTSSDSNLSASGKAAIDNGAAANGTSHQCIVTGLIPRTTYSCFVTSGGTSSSPQNVTTISAHLTVPITSVAFGTQYIRTGNPVQADTFYNFGSNDNLTYFTADDDQTSNMAIYKMVQSSAAPSALNLTKVNALSGYGAFATSNGTDGPAGAPLSNKLSGIFGMLGNLYAFQTRGQYSAAGHPLQTQWFGNVMKSANKGVSWNSWQAPAVFGANGIPPSPLGSFQFGDGTIGWCSPVRYAQDDGTLGYNTAGNGLDGANGYVYIVYGNYWDNGNSLYLMRMPRIYFDAQSTTQIQYWQGPASPTSADFVNDSNWTSTWASSGLTAIFTAAAQAGSSDLTFIPILNRYILLTWYYPTTNSSGPNPSSITTWVVSEGPTPAGPWTQVGTQTNNPSGQYNPVVLHESASSNTVVSNATITLVSAGDYNNQVPYYHPTFSTLTLNPVGPQVVSFQGGGNTSVSSASVLSSSNGSPGSTFNLAAGNTLVVAVLSNGGAVVNTVTDGGSNSLTQIGTTITVVGTVKVSYWLKNNCTANATCTVTATLASGQTFNTISVWQLPAGTWTFDFRSSNTTGASQVAISSPAFNTAFACEMILQLGWLQGSQASAVPLRGAAPDDGYSCYGGYQTGSHQLYTQRQFNNISRLAFSSGSLAMTIVGVGAPSITGNAGIAGATVSYTGTSSGSVTADSSGNYAISNLANGAYTITPSKPGSSFTPSNSAQTVASADIVGVNFAITGAPPSMSLSVPVFVTGGAAGNLTSPISASFATQDGDCIVVAVRTASGGGAITAVRNSASQNFLIVPGSFFTQGSENLGMFYLPNVLANATEIITVVTNAGVSFSAIGVWVIRGADLVNPFDVYTQGNVLSGGIYTSTAFSTGTANEAIIVATQTSAINSTFSLQGGYTLDSAGYPAGAGSLYCGAEHLVVSTLQSGVTAAMGINTSPTDGVIQVAAFKAAAGSAPSGGNGGGGFGGQSKSFKFRLKL